MQLPYILTINPPSLNKANIPIALQAGQKGKIYIYIYSKASFALISGYFFHLFCLFCCDLKAIKHFIYEIFLAIFSVLL